MVLYQLSLHAISSSQSLVFLLVLMVQIKPLIKCSLISLGPNKSELRSVWNSRTTRIVFSTSWNSNAPETRKVYHLKYISFIAINSDTDVIGIFTANVERWERSVSDDEEELERAKQAEQKQMSEIDKEMRKLDDIKSTRMSKKNDLDNMEEDMALVLSANNKT